MQIGETGVAVTGNQVCRIGVVAGKLEAKAAAEKEHVAEPQPDSQRNDQAEQGSRTQ
jgi:hypothetical protein